MGISLGDGNRGTVAEMNVVPLIDILLVLLVIFMIIPHSQKGLKAEIPQPPSGPVESQPVTEIVVQVLADGSVRVNQQSVEWARLQSRLEELFASRAQRTAFVRGDAALQFAVVAQAVDIMRAADITSVGLLTPEMEKGR
jgi:biopolymer transport protein TolR